ncbi:hypothetical protein [Pseudomonas batumici]|uniref:hypothetical protein n=1 Tax=Pseudomonas batumici TaxID=226910 RepID=UPI000589D425|nr:hypothetical protein [Pseudomonas batumici]
MFENSLIALSCTCSKPITVERFKHAYNEELYAGTKHSEVANTGYEHITITSPNLLMEATIRVHNDERFHNWRVGFVQNVLRDDIQIEYHDVTISAQTMNLPALDIMLGYNAPYDEGVAIGTNLVFKEYMNPLNGNKLEPMTLIKTCNGKDPYLDDAPGAKIMTTDPTTGRAMSLRTFSRLMAFKVYIVANEKHTENYEILRCIDWNLYYQLAFSATTGKPLALKNYKTKMPQTLYWKCADYLKAPDGGIGLNWGGLNVATGKDQPLMNASHTALRCPQRVTLLNGVQYCNTGRNSLLKAVGLPPLYGGKVFAP